MTGLNRDQINKLIFDNELFHGVLKDMGVVMDIAHLEKFTELVAATEREACVEALKQIKDKSGVNTDGQAWLQRASRSDFIAAIQARGQE